MDPLRGQVNSALISSPGVKGDLLDVKALSLLDTWAWHQTKSDELAQCTSILHQWLRGIFTPALYESMIDLMIIPRKGREHAKALSMVMMHFTQSPRISNYAFMTYEHQAKQKKRPKCASLSAINHVLILLEHQIFFFLSPSLFSSFARETPNFVYNV